MEPSGGRDWGPKSGSGPGNELNPMESYLADTEVPFALRSGCDAVSDHWRQHYNRERPHSRLGYLSPEDFIVNQKVSP